MPRLSPALVRYARSENPHLTLLLRVCRDLPSARNELRWLQEHSRNVANAKRYASTAPASQGEEQAVNSHEQSPPSTRQPLKLDASRSRDSDVPTTSKTTKLSTKKARGKWRKIRETAIVKHRRAKTVAQISPKASPEAVASESETTETHVDRNPQWKIKYQPVKRSFKERRFYYETEEYEGLLAKNVQDRSKGKPLQYILGSQAFGSLEIKCSSQVLIPRPETEMYTEKMAKLLVSALSALHLSPETPWQRRKKFRILDLCCGTGCIALLIHSILKPVRSTLAALPSAFDIEILGLDHKSAAIDLCRENLIENHSRNLLHPAARRTIGFGRMDVLALAKHTFKTEGGAGMVRNVLNTFAAAARPKAVNLGPIDLDESWDMVIANPPYVSPEDYAPGGKTEPSVRNYEPKDALVPSGTPFYRLRSSVTADLFYKPIRRIAQAAGAQVLVMEVGDSDQAQRLSCNLASQFYTRHNHTIDQEMSNERLELWRDDEAVRILPTTEGFAALSDAITAGRHPDISDRAVVVWSGQLADWRRQNQPTSGLGQTPEASPDGEPSENVRLIYGGPNSSPEKKADVEPSLSR